MYKIFLKRGINVFLKVLMYDVSNKIIMYLINDHYLNSLPENYEKCNKNYKNNAAFQIKKTFEISLATFYSFEFFFLTID